MKQTSSKALRVDIRLDGEKVDLPKDMENSLIAIRAYLEFLAIRQQRVLSEFMVDGVEMRHLNSVPFKDVQSIHAETITYEQLSGRLIETACRQLHRLSEQMNDAVLRVMITERDDVYRQWKDWLPQLNSPLIGIEFLTELWGDQVATLTIGNCLFADHLDELAVRIQETEQIFQTPAWLWSESDSLELSDMLEIHLVPWLRFAEAFLVKLSTLPLE